MNICYLNVIVFIIYWNREKFLNHVRINILRTELKFYFSNTLSNRTNPIFLLVLRSALIVDINVKFDINQFKVIVGIALQYIQIDLVCSKFLNLSLVYLTAIYQFDISIVLYNDFLIINWVYFCKIEERNKHLQCLICQDYKLKIVCCGRKY